MARSLGCDVFLDLKLHDIPKTVERAVGTAASLGAKYLTIHACGGAGMMEAAAKRAESEGTAMKVLGVTVLTSLGPSDLFALGIDESPSERVMRLGTLARQAGLQGLVCSTAEVKQVRQTVGPDMLLVTPGIRPLGADAGDQKRTGTPQEAIADGSDLLVVGRPIRDAADPAEAARDLQAMVLQALE
jgi:orotidine-5'-phosphate decarboxylase